MKGSESRLRCWDSLIPDVLFLIFNQLSIEEKLRVIPLVCKSWKKIVELPDCWKRINLLHWCQSSGFLAERRSRLLRMLVARSLGVVLELRVLYVNDEQMSFIADHAGGSLQTLSLRNNSINESIIENVAPKLSSVTTLKLSYRSVKRLSTRALEAIGRNCKNLESMYWGSCNFWSTEWVKDDEARAIANMMPNLKYLSIVNLSIETKNAIEILSGCPRLESLNTAGCMNDDYHCTLKKRFPKVDVSIGHPLTGYFESISDKEE